MDYYSDAALASEIEARVLDVPGVTAIFRAGQFPSRLFEAGQKLFNVGRERSSLVQLNYTPEGLTVELALGVSGTLRVVETVRKVDEVVLALTQHRTGVSAARRVTVVHIE